MNPLLELARYGQSAWLDFITRRFTEEGRLARLVADDGLRGVTSNPTLFQKAIMAGADYDAAMEPLLRQGLGAHAVYEALAIEDIRKACDALAPVHEATRGADGWVSLEVNPRLALDAEATAGEALTLRRRVDRANLMIKIPATREGLPAVERVLAEGVSVNVTLIFSLDRYREVLEAWRAGLSQARAAGRDLSKIGSVASFFVSRVDTAVDALLEERASRAQGARQEAILALRGKAAIANARLAYDIFRATLAQPAVQALLAAGARPQRPLWASTSTKNPRYRDVLYVEELIGRDTVNTLPLQTLEAFREHGRVRDALSENLAPWVEAMQGLERLDIDLDKVTAQLEEEGVKAFVDSYEALLGSIEQKRHPANA